MTRLLVGSEVGPFIIKYPNTLQSLLTPDFSASYLFCMVGRGRLGSAEDNMEAQRVQTVQGVAMGEVWGSSHVFSQTLGCLRG